MKVKDVMLSKDKFPMVNSMEFLKVALDRMSDFRLGIVCVVDEDILMGIITDGELRRFSQKNQNFYNLQVKKVMTKNPIGIDKNELAAKALSLMNNKKITSLCVYEKKNKSKTIGVLHIHHILQSNIT